MNAQQSDRRLRCRLGLHKDKVVEKRQTTVAGTYDGAEGVSACVFCGRRRAWAAPGIVPELR